MARMPFSPKGQRTHFPVIQEESFLIEPRW